MYQRLQGVILWCIFLCCIHTASISVEKNGYHTNGSRRPRIIICDLDGVLLRTSRKDVIKQLLRSYAPISCSRLLQMPWNAYERYQAFIRNIDTDDQSLPYAYDASGTVLPACMKKWLAGYAGYHSHQLLPWMIRQIRQHVSDPFWQDIFIGMSYSMYDPEIRIRSTHIQKRGLRLLRKLHRSFPTMTYAVLSNYDEACFSRIYQNRRFSRLFHRGYFDNIFISADLQMLKPDPEIFYAVCDQYHVAPAECIMIDDQQANLQAARSIGMHTIHFDHRSARRLYDEIRGLLQKS